MTTDIVASGDAGLPPDRSEFDASNLGLFPQLIDVIHAMTSGQELLAQKLRSVRLLHAEGAWTFGDDPLPRVHLDAANLSSAGNVASSATGTTALGDSRIMVDTGADPAPRHLRSSSAVVEVAPDPAATVAAPPPNEVPEIRGRHVRRQENPLLATDASGAVPAAVTRDYNFFDELDARLADLQDPDEPAV